LNPAFHLRRVDGKATEDSGALNPNRSLHMKFILRLAASTVVTLSAGVVAFGQHYTQTNLVSNSSGIAPVTDPQLINPWGMSRGSGTDWWVSDNLTGVSTLYNGAGTKNSLAVTIPPADPTNKKTPLGSPTGTIFNGSSSDFLLAPKTPASFLFCTIDGTIAAWNPNVGVAQGAAPPSTHAITVVKTSDGSSYTGLTSAVIAGKRYLYAANFTKGRVDVYDNTFHRVELREGSQGRNAYHESDFDEDGEHNRQAFVDERLPRDFVPFNVQAIGNDVVVTYVLHQEGNLQETDGPGLGYVDIFSSSGQLLRRLEHGSWLNAPWGVALAPLDFGRFSHDLLVAQFAGGGDTESSGVIAAYDVATGKLDGLLEDASGKPLVIYGIWALSPGNISPSNNDAAGAPAAQMYFTAVTKAPGGLFGYLTAVSTDLTEGNDQ
jgi:uncharacterized protein (TIGR03118 family)